MGVKLDVIHSNVYTQFCRYQPPFSRSWNTVTFSPFELEQKIEAGDRLSPPFFVYPPYVDDLLYPADAFF